MSRVFSTEEVAKHKTASDCWIIIDGNVMDVTSFLSAHPGGRGVLLTVAGKDASKQFHSLHKPQTLQQYLPKLCIGTLTQTATPVSAATPSLTPSPSSPSPSSSSSSSSSSLVKSRSSNFFGEGIPYGDPTWYQDWNSPYFDSSHRLLRDAIRKWVDQHVMPFCHEWDEKKALPRSLYIEAAKIKLLATCVGSPYPTQYVGSDPILGVLPVDKFNPFHELVLVDEMGRAGSGGLMWGLYGGLSIGLPPVMQFGSKHLREKVVAPCLHGEKIICLAITEPYAGSDVANLKCTAVKTPDGKHYIVNGEKKWITNGVWADYFTVAVRTGGAGMGGVSMLLVERSAGVTTKQMQCSGVWPSGTTYITFEDVKVPVDNLIGNENEGFKYIMYNFNHERWGAAAQAIRFSRVLLEESLRYSLKRKTFGKRLIEHPVIRFKLAHMARQVEAAYAWLELVTYQMSTMSHKEQNRRLGGPIALLKAHGSVVMEFCAREASQIFGGLAYTRGGQGEKVERLYREVRAFAIPAGSEEIMLDLGVRQAIQTAMASRL